MTAVILAFPPRRSPTQAICRPGDGVAPFTSSWCEHHLPLIDAAMDLLSADDVEFTRRCQAMRDQGGRAQPHGRADPRRDGRPDLTSSPPATASASGLTQTRTKRAREYPRTDFTLVYRSGAFIDRAAAIPRLRGRSRQVPPRGGPAPAGRAEIGMRAKMPDSRDQDAGGAEPNRPPSRVRRPCGSG